MVKKFLNLHSFAAFVALLVCGNAFASSNILCAAVNGNGGTFISATYTSYCRPMEQCPSSQAGGNGKCNYSDSNNYNIANIFISPPSGGSWLQNKNRVDYSCSSNTPSLCVFTTQGPIWN